jgi:hypothetical protein
MLFFFCCEIWKAGAFLLTRRSLETTPNIRARPITTTRNAKNPPSATSFGEVSKHTRYAQQGKILYNTTSVTGSLKSEVPVTVTTATRNQYLVKGVSPVSSTDACAVVCAVVQLIPSGLCCQI